MKRILSGLLIVCFTTSLVACVSKEEPYEPSVTISETTTEIETSTTETLETMPTATPTPRPTPRPTNITTTTTAKPDNNYVFESVFFPVNISNMSTEELKEFNDLFEIGFYHHIFGDANGMEVVAVSDYNCLWFYRNDDFPMNFRYLWLLNDFDDARDNYDPYGFWGTYYLQHSDYVVEDAIADFEDFAADYDNTYGDLVEYGGAAYLTPKDAVESQIQEFTGYTNSELMYPFEYVTFDGELFACYGPTRQGGYDTDRAIYGHSCGDGRYVIYFKGAYDNGCLAEFERNEDGTLRIIQNYHLDNIFIVGSSTREMSVEDILASFTEEQNDADKRMTLWLSENAYLAAYGVIFDDPMLQCWFEGTNWYEPTIPESEFDMSMLTDTELVNMQNTAEALEQVGT